MSFGTMKVSAVYKNRTSTRSQSELRQVYSRLQELEATLLKSKRERNDKKLKKYAIPVKSRCSRELNLQSPDLTIFYFFPFL